MARKRHSHQDIRNYKALVASKADFSDIPPRKFCFAEAKEDSPLKRPKFNGKLLTRDELLEKSSGFGNETKKSAPRKSTVNTRMTRQRARLSRQSGAQNEGSDSQKQTKISQRESGISVVKSSKCYPPPKPLKQHPISTFEDHDLLSSSYSESVARAREGLHKQLIDVPLAHGFLPKNMELETRRFELGREFYSQDADCLRNGNDYGMAFDYLSNVPFV